MADFEAVPDGLQGRIVRTIDRELVTSHVGGRGTFATPAMIGLMELTSHRSVEAYLPEGFTTVGYEVCVRHLAPSEPGAEVVVTSKLQKRDGRKLLFEVECREGDKLCGQGTHKRAIVPAFT